MVQQVGKWIVLAGTMIALCGAALWTLGRLGVDRLPGDLVFGGKGWKVILPLGTSVLLSILLTLALWLIARAGR